MLLGNSSLSLSLLMTHLHTHVQSPAHFIRSMRYYCITEPAVKTDFPGGANCTDIYDFDD